MADALMVLFRIHAHRSVGRQLQNSGSTFCCVLLHGTSQEVGMIMQRSTRPQKEQVSLLAYPSLEPADGVLCAYGERFLPAGAFRHGCDPPHIPSGEQRQPHD
jgi:hypothetical protein